MDHVAIVLLRIALVSHYPFSCIVGEGAGSLFKGAGQGIGHFFGGISGDNLYHCSTLV